MKRLQLETAPIIPEPEMSRLLGVSDSEKRSLRERGAYSPEVRGNGRAYCSFAELSRVARIVERERR